MSEQTNRVMASDAGVRSAQTDPRNDPMRMDQQTFNAHYKLSGRVKQKPELREQGILLSVRHLKQFFFVGKGANRQKLKAVGHDCYSTYAEGQSNVAICIYASESKNDVLGLDEAREIVNPASNLLEFERAVPKGSKIEVTVELDEAGMLDVSGRSLVDNGRCHFQLHVTGTLNDKGLDAAEKQIAAGDVR